MEKIFLCVILTRYKCGQSVMSVELMETVLSLQCRICAEPSDCRTCILIGYFFPALPPPAKTLGRHTTKNMCHYCYKQSPLCIFGVGGLFEKEKKSLLKV
jgi:hypothetical protein